jgi:Arc/MetJ-type ribon-helix-helix transcriptional regulator
MSKERNWSKIWETIREELHQCGIDLGDVCPGAEDPNNIRVVCIAPGLTKSLTALGQTARDQVVMVRLDQETTGKLDAWVETGAVRSRSEAAALFIREGLQVRARELERLEDALHNVQKAKDELHQKAREVLGRDPDE